jgi:hypothetical protein
MTRRRRALLTLGGITACALLLPVTVALTLFGVADDDPLAQPAREAPQPPAPTGDQNWGEWDVTAQTDLATRAMPHLPEAAAWPHVLAQESGGPPITLPAPGSIPGVVPTGFPPTVEGAIAQLAALTRIGLAGGDPQQYRRAYESISLPGAPPVETTRLHRDLTRIRARVAGLPPSGPVAGMVFVWTPTSALVKGTTDGGRYAVVCVLGELVTGLNGRSVSSGAADCQALRRVDEQWRISPGAAAAPASVAWPGSAFAVRAGYRAVR